MYMIYDETYGPHKPLDPCLLSPTPMAVDHASYHPLPPIVEDITPWVVSSIPPNIGLKLHPNMEYDQVHFPTWVAHPPVPHDSLNDKPPRLVNLEVMHLSIDNFRNIMTLSTPSLSDLKHV